MSDLERLRAHCMKRGLIIQLSTNLDGTWSIVVKMGNTSIVRKKDNDDFELMCFMTLKELKER